MCEDKRKHKKSDIESLKFYTALIKLINALIDKA